MDDVIEKIDLDKVDWRGSRDFFESLGETLDRLDDKDEAYDFTWVGKRKAVIEAGAPINKTFQPNVEASKDWETTENLFIEGDNLDALKLLQESYLGKVKMIYIDPPYNTGKDFVYHDNFKAAVEDYDEATEYKDDEGNIQFRKNEKSNGRYHSDWLSMMYPRLKLARNLLLDDGVIFISIDDNEHSSLRKMCDEVFGEDNFIATVLRKSKIGGGSDSSHIVKEHDYLLVYARNEVNLDAFYSSHESKYLERYKHKDEFGRFFWDTYARPGLASGENDSLIYDLIMPDGVVINKRWRRSKARYQKDLEEGIVRLEKNAHGWSVQFKQYLNLEGKKPRTLDFKLGSNNDGSSDIIELFGTGKIFDYPKPVSLVKYLASIIKEHNYIVLDFFAGSSSTAHAVMQLNAEDGGSRKWIMVQLPEETDKGSEAFKAGYKSIPDIARERIRRAGEKIAKEHPDAKVDYGFRSLTIADTNYKEVYKTASETNQQLVMDTVDNVKDDRTDLDLLFGVLTASALELNRPIETRDLSGSSVYLYDYFSEASGLVACFAESVSEETIKEIAALKPITAVFKDSSFADSQAKVNLSEHFRIISPDTKVKVI